MSISREYKFRVWWIPQVPGKPFYHECGNLEEARLLEDALAKYDIFQLKNNIKPDFCNAGGIEVWENDEWISYEDQAA